MADIKAVCIDIDQTLLDFDACAFWCIQQGFKDWNLPVEEDTFATFKKINDQLWLDQENKILDHETFLQIRWNLIFEALGFEGLDGPAFEDLFRRYLNDSHVPVKGALHAVKVLSRRYPLYIASNGPSWQQKNRLSLAGMMKYFQDVFTSQEFGVQKPDPLFFERAFEAVKKENPGIKKEEVLMIGDSLTADMEGAKHAGWKTIWFDGWDGKKGFAVCRNWKDVLQTLDLNQAASHE